MEKILPAKRFRSLLLTLVFLLAVVPFQMTSALDSHAASDAHCVESTMSMEIHSSDRESMGEEKQCQPHCTAYSCGNCAFVALVDMRKVASPQTLVFIQSHSFRSFSHAHFELFRPPRG